MTKHTRPGYEIDRKLTLGQDEGDGVVLDATPAERIKMVWPLTQDSWTFFLSTNPNAQREFQRHIEHVIRGRG